MPQAGESQKGRSHRPPARRAARPPAEEKRRHRLAEHVGQVAERVRVEGARDELQQDDGQARPGRTARSEQREEPQRGREPGCRGRASDERD